MDTPSTTLTWAQVRRLKPCAEALAWGQSRYARRQRIAVSTLLAALIRAKQESWANWLLGRCLTPDQCVQYAVFAARQVLHHYETAIPNDPRPRRSIEAAEAYLAASTPEARAAWAAGAAERQTQESECEAAFAALEPEDVPNA